MPVGTRFFDVLRFGFSTFVLGFFDVRRLCDDAEEVSLKMPSRSTAAIEAGARGFAERVSRRPFGSYVFFVHQRQPTNGCRRVYRLASASAAAGMNRDGYHPVLMVNEYCGTGRPVTMNTGWHCRLSQRPGLFFGVLVPVGPHLQTPAATIQVVVVVTWCFLGATPSLSRHGSVEKIRRTKKNQHILI